MVVPAELRGPSHPLRQARRQPPPRVRWNKIPGAAAARKVGAEANKMRDNALKRGNRVMANGAQQMKRNAQFYAMKQEYNRAIARARSPANVQKLKAAYKARRRNLGRQAAQQSQAASLAARKAAARVAADMGMKPLGRIRGAPTKQVARALSDLVAVLEDIMRMSGHSLTRIVRKLGADAAVPALVNKVSPKRVAGAMKSAYSYVPAPVNRAARSGVVTGLGTLAYAAGFSLGLGRQVLEAMFGWVVPGFRFPMGVARVDMVLARAGKALMVEEPEPRLAPIVYDAIMVMGDAAVGSLVRSVLDTYVTNPYKSSGSSGGVLCTICGKAACSSARPGKANASVGPRIALHLQKAFRAINALLNLDHRRLTITTALYSAMRVNLSPVAQFVMAAAGKLRLETFASRIAILLYDPIMSRIRKFGLGMDRGAFTMILWKHFPAIVRPFITGDMRVSIEPLLIDIVKNSQPLGLLTGVAAGLSGSGGTTSQFCSMCAQTCSA